MREAGGRVPDRGLGVHVREGEAGRRGVFRPPVHARGHDDLRCEARGGGARLPFFEEGEEGEGEPVGPDGIGADVVVEGLLGDVVEVGLAECVGGRDGWLLERPGQDAGHSSAGCGGTRNGVHVPCIVEEHSDVLLALCHFFC